MNTAKETFGEKLFTSIKKKKARGAALVTGKMPKLGNRHSLVTVNCKSILVQSPGQ